MATIRKIRGKWQNIIRNKNKNGDTIDDEIKIKSISGVKMDIKLDKMGVGIK